jgi:predicted nucleic acid-binding protein
MEKIVLDANILFSNILRGLFLWLSSYDLCQPIWSALLWDEVIRNISDNDEERQQMREKYERVIFKKFPSAMRTLNPGYSVLGLPDPDDEHVVALARQEDARIVVTFNLKDFPAALTNPVCVQCLDPDSYLSELYDKFPEVVRASVTGHIMNLRETKPKKADYFTSLKKAGVRNFAMKLEAEDSEENAIPEIWN